MKTLKRTKGSLKSLSKDSLIELILGTAVSGGRKGKRGRRKGSKVIRGKVYSPSELRSMKGTTVKGKKRGRRKGSKVVRGKVYSPSELRGMKGGTTDGRRTHKRGRRKGSKVVRGKVYSPSELRGIKGTTVRGKKRGSYAKHGARDARGRLLPSGIRAPKERTSGVMITPSYLKAMAGGKFGMTPGGVKYLAV